MAAAKSVPALPPVPDKIDDIVGKYVKLRDTIKLADDAHELKLEKAKAYLKALNAALLDKLNAVGGDSVATPHGTAYRTTRRSASIADGAVFRDFVIENEAYDLVDWKANAPACDDYLKSEGDLPPGINLTTAYTVGVRRA